MKYKAKQLKTGQWAVFTGSRYWSHTATDNKLQAEQTALVMSMTWYQEQMDKAWDELCESAKEHDSLGDPILEGYEYSVTKGDMLC